MNIISQILQNKNKTNTKAFIPFLTAGYPDIETNIRALHILDDCGADIIELGVPYADALADGPVIQQSSAVSLKAGIYIEQVLFILGKVSKSINAAIVIFTYYNPILSMGIANFILKISKKGARGLLIPDLPLEEIDYVLDLCKLYRIELILFVAPTSSSNRIDAILSKSSGCIYLVSSTGVTGARSQISSHITELSHFIKSNSRQHIIVGFGISNVEQVQKMSSWNIDGIVIGSAVIDIIAKDPNLDALKFFCQSIRRAI
uniref:Tryptophan synthase alpha chain n=1 Tax=Anotrichium furcellatum TaxID=41999 RepID=A0A4D6WJE0_9FLOR|nr:Tryptophan synthase alpha subunit [Anotrichium furcellatum]